MKHLSPSSYLVYRFGGVRKAAGAIGRDPSTVSRWAKSGRVPSSIQRQVLKKAKELRLDITAKDLIFGRKVRELR